MSDDAVERRVLEKYDLLTKLGKGAYGIVWKAIDKKGKQVVALKKVFDAFANQVDAQRTFREELNGHPNIIRLLNIIKAENDKDLYLVFDYMETDLHVVIRAGLLQDIHKRWIIYQLLKAFKFIHSGELIHRDLKPANILLNANCDIKVADFGLARSLDSSGDENQVILSDYVATRWYRAPEILFGSTKYTKAVDMWSIGCILGEMILGKPIFQGQSTIDQIRRVLALTGIPTDEDIADAAIPLAPTILQNESNVRKRSFTNFFPDATEDEMSLLKMLLVFNPLKRPSVEQALQHKYVSQFSCPVQEILCDRPVRITINDNVRLSIKDYREALYHDINERNNLERKKWQQKLLSKLAARANALEQDRLTNTNNDEQQAINQIKSEQNQIKQSQQNQQELSNENSVKQDVRRTLTKQHSIGYLKHTYPPIPQTQNRSQFAGKCRKSDHISSNSFQNMTTTVQSDKIGRISENQPQYEQHSRQYSENFTNICSNIPENHIFKDQEQRQSYLGQPQGQIPQNTWEKEGSWIQDSWKKESKQRQDPWPIKTDYITKIPGKTSQYWNSQPGINNDKFQSKQDKMSQLMSRQADINGSQQSIYSRLQNKSSMGYNIKKPAMTMTDLYNNSHVNQKQTIFSKLQGKSVFPQQGLNQMLHKTNSMHVNRQEMLKPYAKPLIYRTKV